MKPLDCFDQKGTLSTVQFGERAKRTTTDHLQSLGTTVRKGQANFEHIASVFFDTEKAYDLTWRHGTMKDLNDSEIAGRMFNLIQNFLKQKPFKKIISDTKS